MDIEELVTVEKEKESESVEREGKYGDDGGTVGRTNHCHPVGETACNVV